MNILWSPRLDISRFSDRRTDRLELRSHERDGGIMEHGVFADLRDLMFKADVTAIQVHDLIANVSNFFGRINATGVAW